jgi:hypothetical protein
VELIGFDSEAWAVLDALAADNDSKARGFAANQLGTLGSYDSRLRAKIVATLERMVADQRQLDGDNPKVTVGELAADQLELLKRAERSGGQ